MAQRKRHLFQTQGVVSSTLTDGTDYLGGFFDPPLSRWSTHPKRSLRSGCARSARRSSTGRFAPHLVASPRRLLLFPKGIFRDPSRLRRFIPNVRFALLRTQMRDALFGQRFALPLSCHQLCLLHACSLVSAPLVRSTCFAAPKLRVAFRGASRSCSFCCRGWTRT